jgi:hypothetical protein
MTAQRTTSSKPARTFENCLAMTEEHYVVPPRNIVRVVVSWTAFNAYISVEDLCDTGKIDEGQRVRRWEHREGTARGCGTPEAARARGKEIWRELKTRERPR